MDGSISISIKDVKGDNCDVKGDSGNVEQSTSANYNGKQKDENKNNNEVTIKGIIRGDKIVAYIDKIIEDDKKIEEDKRKNDKTEQETKCGKRIMLFQKHRVLFFMLFVFILIVVHITFIYTAQCLGFRVQDTNSRIICDNKNSGNIAVNGTIKYNIKNNTTDYGDKNNTSTNDAIITPTYNKDEVCFCYPGYLTVDSECDYKQLNQLDTQLYLVIPIGLLGAAYFYLGYIFYGFMQFILGLLFFYFLLRKKTGGNMGAFIYAGSISWWLFLNGLVYYNQLEDSNGQLLYTCS